MIYLFETKRRQTMLTPLKLSEEVKQYIKEKLELGEKFDNKLFVNLSNIEWVNTSTLVELILMIGNWLKEGLEITLALPNPNIFYKDKKHLDNNVIANQIYKACQKRKDVREWLYKLKFINAISFKHLSPEIRNNIKVLDIFDREYCLINPSEFISGYYKEHGSNDIEYVYRKGVPLTWIDTETDDLSELLKEVKNKLEKAGLEKSHSENISNKIIFELIKNVKNHSGETHALLCITLNTRFNNSMVERTDFLYDEYTYCQSIFNEERIIEIAFGDCGHGVIKTLQQRDEYKNHKGGELIRLAFDKWSTRIPYTNREDYIKRGTRGLYHIRRIAMKYDSFSTIRCEDKFAGFNDLSGVFFDNEILPKKSIDEKSNLEINLIKRNNELPFFKGTLVSIKLLPDKTEKFSYRYYPKSRSKTTTSKKSNTNWGWIEVDINNYEDKLFEIGEISKNDPTKLFLISLKEKHLEKKPEIIENYHSDVRIFLTKLSDMRHPNTYIVYGFPINFNNDEFYERIEKNVEDLIEEIKREGSEIYQESYTYFDPVMLISPSGELYWVGIDNLKIKNILKKLSQYNERIDKKEIENNQELIQFVNSDKELIELKGDEIFLKFNNSAPIDFYKNIIKEKITELIVDYNSCKQYTLTPNLKYTKGWFPIESILRYKNEYALSLYSLWIENRELVLSEHFPNSFIESNNKERIDDIQDINVALSFNEKLDKVQKDNLNNNLKVLVESELDKPLGEMLLQLLNISDSYNNLKVLSDEVDIKKPRRIPLFDSTDFVIIVTSIVLTQETVKNLIKSVLRSHATPLTVLSLIDFSDNYKQKNNINRVEEINRIPVWGHSILYFSLYPDNSLIPKDNNFINPIYIKPYSFEIEDKPKKPEAFLIEEEFKKLINKSKSLHFNHIGKPNGRHFTFYFNAFLFLKANEGIIWNLFKTPIASWLKINHYKLDDINYKEIKERSISIWFPDTDYNKGFQGQGKDLSRIIKNGFNNDYKIIVDVESTSREKPIIKKIKVDPQKNNYKIIVDWGALTGESIEKLIFKAHNNGYKYILVCIFLNQLPVKKKSFITSISKITTKFPLNKPNENTVSQLSIFDVTEKQEQNKNQGKDELGLSEFELSESFIHVEFINNFPLTCYESDYECNVCALIEDLNNYSIPGIILNRFLATRKSVLSIRPREVTLQNPFDFYSKNGEEILLDSVFIMKMFDFKILLSNAQTSTYWRLEIKIKLLHLLKSIVNTYKEDSSSMSPENDEGIWTKIINKCNEILSANLFLLKEEINLDDFNISDLNSETHSIIYLLSIETAWVQKPPLSLIEIRQILSLISKAIIFNNKLKIANDLGNKDTKVIRIKYAAITVLRMSEKTEFIRNLSKIFINTRYNNFYSNSIIENLVFQINTFISKEYHSSHDEIKPLITELEIIDKLDINQHTIFPIKEAIWHLIKNASSLNIRGDIRKLTKSRMVETCLKALDYGIEKYNASHTKFRECFLELKLPSIDSQSFLTYKEQCVENWKYVSNFITNIIRNHLIALEPILTTDWAINEGAHKISNFLFYVNIGKDDNFSVIMNTIIESNFETLKNQENILKYDNAYKEIGECFLWHPHYTGGKSSILLNILKKLNSDLYEICKPIKNKFPKINLTGIEKLQHSIFYPSDLSIELFEEIFKNANDRIIDDQTPEIIITIIDENVNFIFYKIVSKNTINQHHTGKGLLKHQELLPFFDGELKYDPNLSGDFYQLLKFLKYE